SIIVEDDTDKNDVLRHKRGADKQYSFDVVFTENSTQEEVYEITTKPLVKDVLNGTINSLRKSGSVMRKAGSGYPRKTKHEQIENVRQRTINPPKKPGDWIINRATQKELSLSSLQNFLCLRILGLRFCTKN
ncbi:hypothetical protein ILUMI_06852, partial [Ignelater luminosus]